MRSALAASLGHYVLSESRLIPRGPLSTPCTIACVCVYEREAAEPGRSPMLAQDSGQTGEMLTVRGEGARHGMIHPCARAVYYTGSQITSDMEGVGGCIVYNGWIV